MKKLSVPKINSIHFAAGWIGASLLIGGILPLAIWLIWHIFVWWLCVIGGILLLGFVVVFAIEMRQDFGKEPHYKRHLKETIPFDPQTQYAVIRSSICTGEKVAGFKNMENGHFTEVMLIQSEADEQQFKKTYHLNTVKKEY